MIIDWKIQCFDRKAKSFFDRYVLLDTKTLDPLTRSRVELCIEERESHERELVKHRHLFKETEPLAGERDFQRDVQHLITVSEYYEDEEGKEISRTEAARIRHGNNNIVVFPGQMRPHDIDLSLSDNSPVPDNPQDHIHLTQEELDGLAYFVKDVVELKANAFYGNSPTLHWSGQDYTITTIGVAHITAYMVTFRRMYMQGERGNYNSACAIYARRFLNKRLTAWITAERRLYNKFLAAKARCFAAWDAEKSFTNRTLINTMLTVRFFHQPKDDLRAQYETCLQEVGDLPRLEWVFYNAVFEASLFYARAHGFISQDLRWYLKATGRKPTFDFDPYLNEMGRGEQLTAEEKKEAAIRRHAEKAGREMWELAGRPERQLERFIKEAEDNLRE